MCVCLHTDADAWLWFAGVLRCTVRAVNVGDKSVGFLSTCERVAVRSFACVRNWLLIGNVWPW